MAEMNLVANDKAKKVMGSSTHCRNPNRMLVAPAMKVPYKNMLLEPILLMNLPNTGEKTIVVIKTEL